mmetsp:Transcript_18753/g.35935  ORF Transcript_18753/g.35935 Transcript_18753/m.35935 type:complete len:268 (-) Transcript_18753:192-995(-)
MLTQKCPVFHDLDWLELLQDMDSRSSSVLSDRGSIPASVVMTERKEKDDREGGERSGSQKNKGLCLRLEPTNVLGKRKNKHSLVQEEKKTLLKPVLPADPTSKITISSPMSDLLLDSSGWVPLKRQKRVQLDSFSQRWTPRRRLNSSMFLLVEKNQLSNILSYLDFRSLARAACVCKDLRPLAKDDSLWEKFERDAPAPHLMIAIIARRSGVANAYYSRVKMIHQGKKDKRKQGATGRGGGGGAGHHSKRDHSYQGCDRQRSSRDWF